MTAPHPTLTRADAALLTEAINEAECWRGSKHPDDWPEFDARIAEMRAALAKVRKLQRETRALRAAAEALESLVMRLEWINDPRTGNSEAPFIAEGRAALSKLTPTKAPK